MISNGFVQPEMYGNLQAKVFNFVSEEKLRNRLEEVLLDRNGCVLIPISNKNRILHMLILLEQLFFKSQKLQSLVLRNQDANSENKDKTVLYLEHMSRDTIDVAKSHLNWMNFKGGFQDNEFNPLVFKHIRVLSSMRDMQAEMDL